MNRSFNAVRSRTLSVACLLSLIALSACDSAPQETGSVRASLQFGAVRPASGKTGTASLTAEAAADVTIDEVKLLVRSVRFHNDDEGELEFKDGPFVVTVDPQSTANTVAIGEVPPGRYDRVTFTIHRPESAETIPDPDFNLDDQGRDRHSMIISGDYKGLPFTLLIRTSFQQRVELNPPLVVNEGDQAVNVTLLADISRWFTGKKGESLNPLIEKDQREIEKAIEDSFRGLSTKRGGKDDKGDKEKKDKEEDEEGEEEDENEEDEDEEEDEEEDEDEDEHEG